ncbi:hypothetical protein GCM10020295_57810 [Streptomyces cinereospinus]
MNVSVVLFTADLRLHDHPPLRAALDGSRQVVPLFVHDSGVADAGFAVPNRAAFLADCLGDLDAGLRARGGRLVVRSGDVVREVRAVAAETDADEVHMASDVSAYAHRREERLRAALEAEGGGCTCTTRSRRPWRPARSPRPAPATSPSSRRTSAGGRSRGCARRSTRRARWTSPGASAPSRRPPGARSRASPRGWRAAARRTGASG